MTTSIPRTTAVLVLLLAVTTTACTKVGAEGAEGPEPETTATNVSQEHVQRQPCIPSATLPATGEDWLRAARDGALPPSGIDPGFTLGAPESEWRGHRDHLLRAYVLEALDEAGQEHQYQVEVTNRNESQQEPVCLALTLNPEREPHGPLLAVKLECPASPMALVDDPGITRAQHLCTREEAKQIKALFFEAHGRPSSRREEVLQPGVNGGSVPDTTSEYRWDLADRRLTLQVESFQPGNWRRADVEDESMAQDLCEVTALYEEAVSRRREAIRQHLRPRDLMSVKAADPRVTTLTSSAANDWKDRRVSARVWSFERGGLEEPRGINGVEFDLVIESNTGEELCRMEQAVVELNPPLVGVEEGAAVSTGTTSKTYYDGAGITISYDYSSSDAGMAGCERVRRSPEGLRVEAEVTRVQFTDGEVVGS